MDNWLSRTELLIGSEKIKKLQTSCVAIFGLGGVGSYSAEAIVRSGIGKVILVDNDIIDITNINRQLLADTKNIGKNKVDIAKKRYLDINPKLTVDTYQVFYNNLNQNDIFSNCDYVVDAIDSISSKLLLIESCITNNIPIISCMGTGNKLDPSKLCLSDISHTTVCPLAKKIRKSLKEKNIKHLPVLYSTEEPKIKNSDKTIPSISFVPSTAGLMIAGKVITDLMNK